MRKKLPGFMGRTHSLLSIILFLVCALLPIYPLQTTIGTTTSNIVLFIAAMIMVVGGALLPDCDNSESKAGYTLGFVGSILTIFMKSTSAVVWNVYHFKGDQKPMNQHRFLWHAPIIGIGLTLLFYFGIQGGNYTIFTNISNSVSTGQFPEFIKNNTVLFLFIILSFMAALVGSSAILSLLNKVLPVPFFVKYILPVVVVIYIFTASYSDLRVLGVCLGAGYLFHCLEDFFADTGIPLIWPIPKVWGSNKKVWWRPYIPFRITTGGMVNTILDLVAAVIAISLIIVVFVNR